jgi:HlyD family secretion protein
VKLGAGDDRSVEVTSGLTDGDVVLQNPPERSESSYSGANDTRSQFGSGRQGTPGAGAPGAGPAGTGGGPSMGGPGGPDGGGPRGAGGGRSMDLMSMDKNGDGKVSRDEAPEQMREFFGRMDTDGDGFITAAEAAEARARRAAAGGGGPGGPGGGAGPEGGGGPGAGAPAAGPSAGPSPGPAASGT